MTEHVYTGKQILITMPNKVGLLSNITTVIMSLGINIEGVSASASGEQAQIMIVTEDNRTAIEALRTKGYVVKEDDVVMMELEDDPGTLEDACSRLAAENIDIKYIYGTSCPSGCPAQLVINTSNNTKAMSILK
ncbi:MAG: ACT domain-containing protein [Candidatus Omnitrophica bacterium]|nr:ACT domain-containing protein [Candidatus Omnitrophota bacterium]MDD5655394.1 ACT domain-containing protein [Candidatus Omnitrophota bacterium]